MTEYTCRSCEHSINADGTGLVCSVTGWSATKRCPAFVYEPGTDEAEAKIGDGEPVCVPTKTKPAGSAAGL